MFVCIENSCGKKSRARASPRASLVDRVWADFVQEKPNRRQTVFSSPHPNVCATILKGLARMLLLREGKMADRNSSRIAAIKTSAPPTLPASVPAVAPNWTSLIKLGIAIPDLRNFDCLSDWHACASTCKAWYQASQPQLTSLRAFALQPQLPVSCKLGLVVTDYFQWRLAECGDEEQQKEDLSRGYVEFMYSCQPKPGPWRQVFRMAPFLRGVSGLDWAKLQLVLPQDQCLRALFQFSVYLYRCPELILKGDPPLDPSLRMDLQVLETQGNSSNYPALLDCCIAQKWEPAIGLPLFCALEKLKPGKGKKEAVAGMLAANPPLNFLIACLKTSTWGTNLDGEYIKKFDFHPRAALLAKVLPDPALARYIDSARPVMRAVADCIAMLSANNADKTERKAFYACLAEHFGNLKPLAIEADHELNAICRTAVKLGTKEAKALIKRLEFHGVRYDKKTGVAVISDDSTD